jgi:hypothetical protein
MWFVVCGLKVPGAWCRGKSDRSDKSDLSDRGSFLKVAQAPGTRHPAPFSNHIRCNPAPGGSIA